MKTMRATITLEQQAYDFLQTVGGDNKSAFINALLRREQQRALEAAILAANEEEADAAYQQELAGWDETLLDGLEELPTP